MSEQTAAPAAPKQGPIAFIAEKVGIILAVVFVIIIGLWLLGFLLSFGGSALESFGFSVASFNRGLIFAGEYLRQTIQALFKFLIPIGVGILVAIGIRKLAE